MRRLRPFLPADYCSRAAWALHGALSRVLIVTGFLVDGRCETDGPPGAMALARAVRALGGEAMLLSDGHAALVLAALDGAPLMPLTEFLDRGADRAVLDFPLLDAEQSDALAARALEVWRPSVVLAIERCGVADDGTYRNMRGEDISAVTARVDGLFKHGLTIGIGDGGNEIGMGTLAEHSRTHGVTDWPSVTPALFPVVAAVSNWGAYGICAALSLRAGRDVLPDEQQALRDVERVCALDGIDAMSRQSIPHVDGRPPEENCAILRSLHAIVESPDA